MLAVPPADPIRSDEFVPLKLEWESLEISHCTRNESGAKKTDGARRGGYSAEVRASASLRAISSSLSWNARRSSRSCSIGIGIFAICTSGV